MRKSADGLPAGDPRRRCGLDERSRVDGLQQGHQRDQTAHNVLHEGAAISALSNKIKSADKSPTK